MAAMLRFGSQQITSLAEQGFHIPETNNRPIGLLHESTSAHQAFACPIPICIGIIYYSNAGF